MHISKIINKNYINIITIIKITYLITFYNLLSQLNNKILIFNKVNCIDGDTSLSKRGIGSHTHTCKHIERNTIHIHFERNVKRSATKNATVGNLKFEFKF